MGLDLRGTQMTSAEVSWKAFQSSKKTTSASREDQESEDFNKFFSIFVPSIVLKTPWAMYKHIMDHIDH